MFIVKELDGKFVVEDGLCLLEGNTVFLAVGCRFAGIPLESDHAYSVLLIPDESRGALTKEVNRPSRRQDFSGSEESREIV